MACEIDNVFEAISPVTIKNIELLENDAKLEQCRIYTISTEDDIDYDRDYEEWKGNDIKLEKGTKIGIDLKLREGC